METIKEKLRKIMALADRGDAGEAIAAQHRLNVLLSKYNLTTEDLFDESLKKRKFKVKRDEWVIFIQVVASIVGGRYKDMWCVRGKRSEVHIELTDSEYIDVAQQVEFHCKQYKRELTKSVQALQTAYVHKHNLFSKDPSESSGENKISHTEYLELISMINRLEDVTFRKQLR